MNEDSIICIAADEGVECATEAVMASPVPLCDAHRLQVALLVVPDILAASLRQSKAGLRPLTLAPEERAAVISGAQARPVSAYMGGIHGPVVYFLDAGERVKIGHSTNLRSRVRALAMQEKDVVLLLQGGLTLERALHATYAKERIDATEWFVKSDRIAEFIASKLANIPVRQPQKAQRQQRKYLVGPQSASAVRRKLSEWVDLAVPLYRHHVTTVGRPPTAPELASLLAGHGHGTLKPSRARDVRSATAEQIDRKEA